MPNVQNLSEVQRKCGVKGRTELHERASTMNRNNNPVEEGGRPQRERGGCSIAPLGRSHQGGGEGVVVESHDDFPGVEISIAGGVGKLVRDNYCDRVFSLYRLCTQITLTLVTHDSSQMVF